VARRTDSCETVAVADDKLYNNGIVTSGDCPADRLRNASRGRTGSPVGRLTWTVGRRQIIRPRKELDPCLLHI
jgi:hypothetical protein